MKNCLLVTLADDNYIERAKQLFSSVYWNAGWQGDYLLLTHNVDPANLVWFQDRGILVYPCDTDHLDIVQSHWPRVIYSKFELFTLFFKQWKVVVYLDADIIVRSSINRLARVTGFAAVKDTSNLGMQFVNTFNVQDYSVIRKRINLIRRRFAHYDLNTTGFNCGVMAFNTDLIDTGTTARLHQLFNAYSSDLFTCEQGILNLLFYRQWTALSPVYNLYLESTLFQTGISPADIKGIILHFVIGKPWDRVSFFYPEWKNNRDKAESIDFNSNPPLVESWSKQETLLYGLYLAVRKRLLKWLNFRATS